MPDTSLVVAGGAACAGAVLFWLAETKAQREHLRWCARAATAGGVISRIAERGRELSRNEPSDDDPIHHVPVVRFRASDGAEYEFEASDIPQTVGAAVTVAYDAAMPSTARVLQRRSRWGCGVVLLVAGIALIAFGLR